MKTMKIKIKGNNGGGVKAAAASVIAAKAENERNSEMWLKAA
jgi:hypothetical protein